MMEETRRRTEVALTEERLEDPKWSVESRVRDDGCGAVATFVGTTRGEFGGKRVISLRYEAYGDMAVKAMK